MTSSAGVRRGERADRERIVVGTEHRRVVDLPADSGCPDGTEHSCRAQALSWIGSRRHGDGHDVHAHRP